MNYLETNNTFDSIKHTDEFGNEFWYARELQKILDYKKWENFKKVIETAKKACENSGYSINEQFLDVRKLSKRNDNANDYKNSGYSVNEHFVDVDKLSKKHIVK